MGNSFPGGIQNSSGNLILIPIVFGVDPPDAASDGILYVFDDDASGVGNTYKSGVAYPTVLEGDAFRYQNLRWEWQFRFREGDVLTFAHGLKKTGSTVEIDESVFDDTVSTAFYTNAGNVLPTDSQAVGTLECRWQHVL